METDGIEEIYMRSLDKHNIRYRPFIGDGDSASYTRIEKLIPCGPLHLVEKHECVNHVTKRMGSALRTLLSNNKGKPLSDRKMLGGTAGGLTLIRCDSIQGFYGKCLRDNKGNVENMSKEVLAILYHYGSTEENPRHDHCPSGESSWCSYKRDEALNTSTHRLIKNPFHNAVIEKLEPVFKRLSDVAFLEGVKYCNTQNPNESLHHVIWSLAPKETYNWPHETSLAINLGVCVFNNGFHYTLSNMMKKLGLNILPSMEHIWKMVDIERIKHAELKSRDVVKLRRKSLKRKKVKKQDAFQRIAEPQYQSGKFYSKKD